MEVVGHGDFAVPEGRCNETYPERVVVDGRVRQLSPRQETRRCGGCRRRGRGIIRLCLWWCYEGGKQPTSEVTDGNEEGQIAR